MSQVRRFRVLAFVSSAALALCATAVAAPNDLLYDQFNNKGLVWSNSQDYESALDSFDNELADDFAVPPGSTWNLTGVEVQGVYDGPGPATSVHVRAYANGAGNLPGTLVRGAPEPDLHGWPELRRHPQPIDPAPHRDLLALGAGKPGLRQRGPMVVEESHRPVELRGRVAEPGRWPRCLPGVAAAHNLPRRCRRP